MAASGTAAALATADPAGPVIEGLVPASVRAVDTTGDEGMGELFPEELEVISNAVAKRRAEFSTVRWCARRALAELGVDPAPILPGLRGAPGWPAGVVGSMTHCAGYRAAVVARSSTTISLGIDAEPNRPLPDGVLGVISRPEERQHLAELRRRHQGHWDRLLFTIKESVYKTWFPLAERWLDFAEASVRIEPATGTFRAELLVPPPDGTELTAFAGRFAQNQELVVSAIVLERSAGQVQS